MAGTPLTIEFFSTSFTTTELAPIMAFSPILTPGRIQAFIPIHAPFSITTAALKEVPWEIIDFSKSLLLWVESEIYTLSAINTSSPIFTDWYAFNWKSLPIFVFFPIYREGIEFSL